MNYDRKLPVLGKAVAKRSRAKYVASHPDKVKARQVLNNAVASGKFPPPDGQVCHKCGLPAVEYHHHEGYAKGKALVVVACCKDCHEAIHHMNAVEA